jgi:hypothetical protein
VWGEATEVLSPLEADAQNRFWWQIRYHPGKDGLPRIILVDAKTGWARLPPPDYRIRLPPPPKVSSNEPLQVSEGSYILVILPNIDANEERQREANREVMRLNALATNTGMSPLFSLRAARDGRSSLIYGWRNDGGIKQDKRIVEWLTLRTPYRDPVWENLAPTP